jgi:phosphoribosylformylglycinamidine synthase PurS subunit
LAIEAPSESDARDQVDEMCQKLLANPVIERYRVSVEGGS